MNAFIFVRLAAEILGFGKYLPGHGLYTAADFAAAFNKAAEWAKDEEAESLLRASGGRVTLWVHGATVRQQEDGSAAIVMPGGSVSVAANGHYETTPENVFLAIAQAVVEYEDPRLSPENRAEVRRVYALTLVQFVELYPVSRAVTAQVRKVLGSLLEE